MAGLTIDLRRPAGGFLYDMTKPRVTIDGYDVVIRDWSRHVFDVMVGGPHRIEIYVPYAFPRRAGRATLDVMVPEEGVVLEYMAPSVTFAKGSLGPAGQQKSSGSTVVRTLNGAAIVLIVGFLIFKVVS
jgi:hypothetical protein